MLKKKEAIEVPEDVIVSREEVVAEMGEEAVAAIEAEAEARDEEIVVVPTESPKASKKDSVTVTYPGGVRTYTKEVHGSRVSEYAEEFASKHPGAVIS